MNAVTAAPVDDRFVTVDIGSTRLALPPGEVRAIDSALDLDPHAGDDSLACGRIDTGSGMCAVYALDEDLQILPDAPASRRVCALLEHQRGRVGVLADAVASLPGAALRLEPLPAAVRVPGSALTGLAVHGDAVMFTTSAARLIDWLLGSRGRTARIRGAAA